MSDYIVTARKWRPMRFDDVAAQAHVTQTLKNAIKQQRLAHAYLFAGPRGVGKTTTARLFAKLVNCRQPTLELEPDNTCEMCREITEGHSFDVLEIDGASNRGVDEIRNLRESVRYGPAKGTYKVYIIDEVHMLTKEAFNALLKTLEEPPPHVLFIFATTEVHKVPATIISRCQRFDFRRIAIEEIMNNLRTIAEKEAITIDEDALRLIAKKGDGSLRDAQSIFDQIVTLCGKDVQKNAILRALNIVDQEFYFRLTDLIITKDAKGGLALVQDLIDRGYDIKEFLSGLTEHLRNMLTVVTTGSTSLIEESDFYKKKYAETAKPFSVSDVLRLLRFVHTTEAALRWSNQPRFKLESDIVQLITMPNAVEVGSVLQQIDEIKKKLIAAKSQPPILTQTTPTAGELRPATAKPNGRPTFTRSAGRRPSEAPRVEELHSSEPSALSEGEVRSRWAEFVSEVRRERIALGTILERAMMQGIRGSTIFLAVPDEFGASVLGRNKELIAAIIKKIFHTSGRLEVTVDPEAIVPASLPQESPPPPPQEEHPIIKAIVRELGAEPM
ncbi:MAG: DNA polymerase III subunit gamma/tau [Ignavibacteria bacterium]